MQLMMLYSTSTYLWCFKPDQLLDNSIWRSKWAMMPSNASGTAAAAEVNQEETSNYGHGCFSHFCLLLLSRIACETDQLLKIK